MNPSTFSHAHTINVYSRDVVHDYVDLSYQTFPYKCISFTHTNNNMYSRYEVQTECTATHMLTLTICTVDIKYRQSVMQVELSNPQVPTNNMYSRDVVQSECTAG